MRNRRALGIVLLVLGIVVLSLSVGADVIGLGRANAFGFKQIIGAVAGAVVAVAGAVLILQRQPI